MARAVQDWQPAPTDKRKGEPFFISLDWFRYLDNFHDTLAHNWLWTPHMLWVNRTFVGDRRGGSVENGADMQPLRLARKPGELIHPTAWKLNTGSVIPPAI